MTSKVSIVYAARTDGNGKPVKGFYVTDCGIPMGEAIALSSPNGTMSKRARKAAMRRLEVALFGEAGMAAAIAPKPLAQRSECELLLEQAARLDGLADRGMCVRKYRKLAAEYRAKAETL